MLGAVASRGLLSAHTAWNTQPEAQRVQEAAGEEKEGRSLDEGEQSVTGK